MADTPEPTSTPPSPDSRDPRESRRRPNLLSAIAAMLGGMLILVFGIYAAIIGNAESLEPPWIAAGVVGVVLLGGWVYTEQDNLRRASGSQSARYSVTSFALLVVALGIAAAVNVLANRYDERIDLTENKRFTLSEQTLSILSGLQAPVTVKAFFISGSAEESDFRSMIEGYEQASDQLSVEFIDPNHSPLLAEQNEITTTWGTVIFESAGVDRRLENEFNEEAITNTLVQLTSGVEHLVCFSSGHQERDPEDTYAPQSVGLLAERLKAANYQTQVISLFREGGVPTECEVFAIIDPQYDWLDAERELLAAYVASGGHVLLMLEPTHATGLAQDFSRYGITIGDDLIFEAGPNAQAFNGDLSYIILMPESFDFHPITQPLQAFTLHRFVRSVSAGPTVEGINVQELAQTTSSSWTKTDLETLEDINPTDTDRAGPIPLMAAAEITDAAAIPINPITPPPAPDGTPVPEFTPEVERAAGARILVIGDTEFASNTLIAQGNNLDLVMNGIAWMVGEEDQISIRPNEAAEGSIMMNLVQTILIWLICLLVAPGTILIGAISTWLSRR